MNSRIRCPLYISFKSWLCCCSLPSVAPQQQDSGEGVSCDKIISVMNDRTQIRHGMHDWTWHVWFITSQTCDAWFTLQISVIGVVSWICYEKLCDAWWLQKISVICDRYSPLPRVVAKRQLPANFAGWERAYHWLKLCWKTKVWGIFQGAVK